MSLAKHDGKQCGGHGGLHDDDFLKWNSHGQPFRDGEKDQWKRKQPCGKGGEQARPVGAVSVLFADAIVGG